MYARLFMLLVAFMVTKCAYADALIFGKAAYVKHVENPEDAINPWRPVVTLVEAHYSTTLDGFLVAETDWYYEGSKTKLALYSNSGALKVRFPEAIGPYLVSSVKTILFCENDGYEGTYDAVLYANDAKKLAQFPVLGYSRDCGISDDGKLFWQRFSNVENNKAKSIVRFLTAFGDAVKVVELSTSGTVLVEFEGRKYEFIFDQPALPG